MNINGFNLILFLLVLIVIIYTYLCLKLEKKTKELLIKIKKLKIDKKFEDSVEQLQEIKNTLLSDIDNLKNEYESYKEKIDNSINKINEHEELIQSYKNEIDNSEKEFENLRKSIYQITELSINEKAKDVNFYKISISEDEIKEIEELNIIKNKISGLKNGNGNGIYNILNKLIWTEYFQKPVNELCTRIFGKEKKCGIYKITNLKTKQCYIGQSVYIQERIKTHIKNGLGINNCSTNKLYSSMNKDKIWNFKFELVEECDQKELNKKEKMWIETFQSNIYGLNSTGGNN